jgi:predicted restriction endonuclease
MPTDGTYESCCAITGCDCSDALEAAHSHPYQGAQTNTTGNGLLLRAGLHALFDLAPMSIDPENLTVVLAERLKTTSYSTIHGMQVGLRKEPAARPSKHALQWHFRQSGL